MPVLDQRLVTYPDYSDRRSDLHAAAAVAAAAAGIAPTPSTPTLGAATTAADFQPPYFPPPYPHHLQVPAHPHQFDFHDPWQSFANSAAAAAVAGYHSGQHQHQQHHGYQHFQHLSHHHQQQQQLHQQQQQQLQHQSHHQAAYEASQMHQMAVAVMSGQDDDMTSAEMMKQEATEESGYASSLQLHKAKHKGEVASKYADAVATPLSAVAGEFSDGSELFCTVPGRLSLLSSISKYNVTVSELNRRLAPPECLNASLLGGVLRRAKSKDGGRSLRRDLDDIGLNLPAGRRKTAPVTLFTALVEGESVRLAKDFNFLCETEFPVRVCADALNKSAEAAASDASSEADALRRRNRRDAVRSARFLVQEVSDLLHKDRSPLCSSRPPPLLDAHTQRQLGHFSLLTHGFGSPALASAFGVLHRVLGEMERQLASPQSPTDA